MNLVENYISDVALYLPDENRHDILTELTELINEQVDDLTESLGRKPSQEELATLLKGIGHPIKVAQGYFPTRYLIGPVMYPIYWHALKFSFFVAAGVYFVFLLVTGLVNGGSAWSFVAGLISLLEIGFWVFAIVTAIFVSIEYSGEKLSFFERWDPLKRLSQKKISVSQTDVISNLVSEGFFLLWWNGRFHFESFWANRFGRGNGEISQLLESNIQLSADWNLIYWPINIVLISYFILHLWVLIRGFWQKQTLIIECILSVPFLVMAFWLLSLDKLVELGGDLSDGRVGWLSSRLDYVVSAIIVFVIAVTIYELYKYFNLYRRSSR